VPRNELEIILRLRDEATRALKRAQGALKGLEGELKRAKAAANRMWSELDRMSGSLATIAGSGGAAYALAAFAKEAYKAEVGTRLFVRQLERMNQDAEAGRRELKRIADRLGVLPDQIADYATQLLRQGLTMRDIASLFQGAAASALAAGKDVLTGIDAVTNAIVNQQSIYLNYAGIAENLDVAYREYAKTLGKTVDALTKEERARAAVLLVQRATKEEVADLDTLLGGLTGKQNRLNKELAEFRRTLGRLVLPSLERLLDVATGTLDAINRAPPWLKQAGASFAVMGTAISGVAVSLGLLRSAILPFLGPVGWFMLAASGGAALAATLSTLSRETDLATRALQSVRGEVERLRGELADAKSADDLIAKLRALGQTLTGPAKEAWTQYIEEAEKSQAKIEDIAKAAEKAIAKFLAVQRVAVESSLKEAQAAFERQISVGLGGKAFERFPKWIKDGLEQAAKEGGLSLLRMIDGATRYLRQRLEHASSSFEAGQYEAQIAHLERLRPLAEKWAAAQAKLNALQEQEKRILAALNGELSKSGEHSNKASQGIKKTGSAAQKATVHLDRYAAAIARLNRELRQLEADDRRGRIDRLRANLSLVSPRQGVPTIGGGETPTWLLHTLRMPGYRRRHGGLGAEMRAQAEAEREALEAASKLTDAERDRRQALAEIRAEMERVSDLAKEHLELQQSLLRARQMEIARMRRLIAEASKLTAAEADRRRAARELGKVWTYQGQLYREHLQYQRSLLRARQMEIKKAEELTRKERERLRLAERYVSTIQTVYSGLDRVLSSFSKVGKDTGAAIRDLWGGFADLAKAIPVVGGILSKVFSFGSIAEGLYKLTWQATVESLNRARAAYEKLGEQMVLIHQRAYASIKTYQEHYLFGLISVDRYKVEVDKLALKIAQTLEQGVLGGLRNAMRAFLEGAEDWQEQLKEGLRSAIENAVIEAVIQGAIFEGVLGEALTKLTEALAKGNYEAARRYVRDIAAQVPELTREITRALEPFRQAMAGLRSGGGGGGGPTTPGTQTIRYELPTAPVLAAPAWVDRMGEHVAKFGEAVDRFAKARINVDVRLSGDLAYSVRGLA